MKRISETNKHKNQLSSQRPALSRVDFNPLRKAGWPSNGRGFQNQGPLRSSHQPRLCQRRVTQKAPQSCRDRRGRAGACRVRQSFQYRMFRASSFAWFQTTSLGVSMFGFIATFLPVNRSSLASTEGNSTGKWSSIHT